MGSSGTGPIIPAEFLIESELDVSFGTVYQGEPITVGGLHSHNLNVTTVAYTTNE